MNMSESDLMYLVIIIILTQLPITLMLYLHLSRHIDRKIELIYNTMFEISSNHARTVGSLSESWLSRLKPLIEACEDEEKRQAILQQRPAPVYQPRKNAQKTGRKFDRTPRYPKHRGKYDS